MKYKYGDNVSCVHGDYVTRELTLRRMAEKSHYGMQIKTVPVIKNVIFNPPATIVLWADGTKTIVKAKNGDIYDPEKGLAMAISKKTLGNCGNYYNIFARWISAAPSYCSNRRPLKTSIDLEIEKLIRRAIRCGIDINTLVSRVIESKKDGNNIEKTCDTCKYGELTWYDEPCEDCLGRMTHWAPIG